MSFKYYKYVSGVYCRVYPNDYYEYFHSTPRKWMAGWMSTWTKRYDYFLAKPIEVSELEILIVLGPKAVQ